MAHYKRRHPRRRVRCILCTPHRNGNSRKRAEPPARFLRADADLRDADG